jgi:uncharacterized membrane protein YesL
MNVLTVLLALPVVTFPPALAGLWYIGNQAANGHPVEWGDYFQGFRRYFLKAWGLALINILVMAIVLTNVWFYAPDVVPFNISRTLAVWIRGIFVALGFIWWCYQLYPMAMLLEQEDQRIRLALRNSAILLIANPGVTFVLGALSLLVIALSLRFPPLILLALSLVAVVCNAVVIHLLKPFREKAQAEKEGSQNEQETSGEPGDEKAG